MRAGPLTPSLRELWVSGLLPPDNGGTSCRAATQEPTSEEGDDSDPGLASQRDCVLTATLDQEVLSDQRG